jgi:hypothetical protein
MVAFMGYSKGVRERKWEENLSRGKFDPGVVGPTRRMVVPTVLVRLVHERARELSSVAGFVVTPTMALASMLGSDVRQVLLGRERGLRRVTLEMVIRAAEKLPVTPISQRPEPVPEPLSEPKPLAKAGSFEAEFKAELEAELEAEPEVDLEAEETE